MVIRGMVKNWGRLWKGGPHVTTINGRVHRLVELSLQPHKRTLTSYITLHLFISKTIVRPTLHRGCIPIKDAMARCKTICPVKVCGKPGIALLQTCVDVTFLSSGILIVKAFVERHLFTTSTLSMIKINVAPVSLTT